jgi:hypothetical protein
MLLLATQSEVQMRQFAHPHLGRLVQPRHYPRLRDTAARGVPWAADNDAFNGWGERAAARFENMIDSIEGLPNCLFVTCPDVVGEAGLTDLLFEEWAPRLHAKGFPVAYVLQEDGIEYEPRGIPWGAMSALFIGCATDAEKLGDRVRALVAAAKRRGMWVHMGRVNSARRIAHAREIGCDSVDGTGWVKWRDAHLARGLSLVAAPPQLSLLTVADPPPHSPAGRLGET